MYKINFMFSSQWFLANTGLLAYSVKNYLMPIKIGRKISVLLNSGRKDGLPAYRLFLEYVIMDTLSQKSVNISRFQLRFPKLN